MSLSVSISLLIDLLTHYHQSHSVVEEQERSAERCPERVAVGTFLQLFQANGPLARKPNKLEEPQYPSRKNGKELLIVCVCQSVCECGCVCVEDNYYYGDILATGLKSGCGGGDVIITS